MVTNKRKPKVLVLFSGGLDSLLTVKILQSQNLEIETLHFYLPFTSKPKLGLTKHKPHIIDCTKGEYFSEYLNIIRSPQHGVGAGINPCLDCKIFLFKKADKLRESIHADFIATGEVLGQRPMSQKKYQLAFTERISGLQGKILRPLSAKLLPETKMEREGLVERNKLLGIKGKNRKTQIILAEKYKLKYPQPAGGCLLCDKYFAKKLKDLFQHQVYITPDHVELLKTGRHFRNKGKIVIGRNKHENNKLENLNKKLNYFIIPQTQNQPTTVYEHPQDKLIAKNLIYAYSQKDLSLRKKWQEYRVEFNKYKSGVR